MEDALEDRAFIHQSDVEANDAHIAEAAKSDPRAFGELYELYYTRVYRYVYHRVGNNHDAEDITAVVFMKALEAIPSYQSGRNGFAPWVFRITRNTVVDYYRRQRKQDPLDEIEHEADVADPVSDALESERREELHRVIQCLSADQRDVVLMRYAADLTFAEIADSMKKSEAAVRMVLHRGLRKMKAVMNDE